MINLYQNGYSMDLAFPIRIRQVYIVSHVITRMVISGVAITLALRHHYHG
jgi:hypothetical protein